MLVSRRGAELAEKSIIFIFSRKGAKKIFLEKAKAPVAPRQSPTKAFGDDRLKEVEIKKNQTKTIMEEHKNVISILKDHEHTDSFNQTSVWLRNNQSENKKLTLKEFFNMKRSKLIYACLILAVLFGACNMPVSQNETVGYMLKWKTDANNTEALAKIKSLSWNSDGTLVTTREKTGSTDYIVFSKLIQNADEKTINGYKNDLMKIGSIYSISANPINESVTSPLYKSVLKPFVNINADLTNKNFEEGKKEILDQLQAMGVDSKDVVLEKDPQGRLQFKMKMDMDNQSNMPDMNINIKDKGEVLKMETKHMTPEEGVDVSKKSDDEIKRDILKNLQKDDPNAKIDDIKIERKDGNVIVKVDKEVKK